MLENFTVPGNMAWIPIAVGVIILFLREFKSINDRKRFLPYLSILLSIGGVLLMKSPFPECITQGIMIGLMAAGGYDALKAVKEKLSGTAAVMLISLVLILPLSACNPIQMPVEYADLVERSAINLRVLNERCQAGDEKACRDGCIVGSKTLDAIVEGMYGVEPEPIDE